MPDSEESEHEDGMEGNSDDDLNTSRLDTDIEQVNAPYVAICIYH